MALTLTACGSSTDQADAEPRDTGIHGIVVPDEVRYEQSTDTVYIASLPNWSLEDTSRWMGEHLPDQIDGLTLQNTTREDIGHGWCYSGEPNEDGNYRMVYVLVSAGDTPENPPASVSVSSVDDAPMGC